MSSLRSSNSSSFKKHEKKITSRLFSQSPTRHRLSRTQMGTFKCRTTQKCAPRPPHASRPPSRAALPPASAACHFFVHGGSTSRLLCAKPAAPPQLGENEHDDRHVSVESHVVITTDTHPINSRARGAGWVAWFGLPLRERPCLGGKCQQARGCSWAFATMLRSS